LGQKPLIVVLESTSNGKILNALERHNILLAKQEGEILKNMTAGGGGIPGYKRSEESKRKMSQKYKGKKPSPLCMEMNIISKLGKKLSVAHRSLLRKRSTKARKIICLTNDKIYDSARHAREDLANFIKCHKSIIHSAKYGVAIKGYKFRYLENEK